MSDASERALAIVGVSAILPDAPDALRFWQNVKDGRYSIGDVPPERWDPALYYDADPAAPDKTYSRIGGWVREGGWEWDPMSWRLPIPPKVSDAMDEAQKWAVACARSVLLDYGHPERPIDTERTAVVIGTAMAGNRHYMTSLRVFFPEYARALAEAPSFAALPAEARDTILRESHDRMASQLPEITEDTMPGELSNCMAGRIANLFDLHGPNFVCDAACASGLAAIDAAREGLITGEYDTVLVGGVDRNMGPAPFVKFSKIGALSATGTRPYADGADGFVMGEGSVFMLLKRLADAEAAGDRIYAVIRGVGGSSDGRGKGITAPNPAGQRLAIERAWRDAGVSPRTAGLVEGHGTSTRVGDVVEVGALTDVFAAAGAPSGTIALGSVKSNIGHLKGAAGSAGLLKAVFALHEHVLPPSLHCDTPNPKIDFASSPFFVNTECKPWSAGPDGVRRAAVSAFGFGGTNYHLVLEEYVPGRLSSRRSVGASGRGGDASGTVVELAPPLRGALLLGAENASGLRAHLEEALADAERGIAPPARAPSEAMLRAPERLAIDYGDVAELAAKGARARKAFDAPAEAQATLWRALRSQGVFRGSGPAAQVAFLYTGQGSQYANMLRELRESEPVVKETFAEADRVMEPLLGKPLSEIVFVDPADEEAVRAAEAELRKTEITQPAVLAVDIALTRLLARYGLVPDMVMGHSLGEYGALVASGALPFADALEAVSARGKGMAALELEDVGRMAAVIAPLAEVESTLEEVEGNVVIANVNSTHQVVIGGATAPVEAAIERLGAAGHQVVPLNVSHAFHTTIVAPASEPLRETLERMDLAPPTVPLIGNVEGEPYPMGPDAVPRMLDLLAAQVASPVQFVKGLRRLHDLGARVFVEVGPKKALHGFAADVLGEDEAVVSLFTNHPKLGDAASFNQALCGLWAAGLGIGRQESVDAPRPTEAASATLSGLPEAGATQAAAARTTAAAGAVPDDRFAALGRLFAEFTERGAALLGQGGAARVSAPAVVTGASLGLPGRERVFADDNVQRILDGEQEIDLIPTRFRHAMVEKHVTRLVKTGGDPHFESIENSADVIKLAARSGKLDLAEEFGVPADRIAALDVSTRLAMAAGLEALRDAGLPLALRYRTTTRGTYLPDRWMLPESLRDETGVIFASAFPGYDAFADELTRYGEDRRRSDEIEILRALRGRMDERPGADEVLAAEIDRRIHELEEERREQPYLFDRRFLFRVLPMAHSQFAEYVGARGPNTHVNSACASTTQAFALAEDWIAAGRCRRVVVIAADDVTSDHLLEWVGAGFLATGAAATDDVVEDAALPFDRRRHGMILGMGAAGVVIEAPECAAERGLRPICEIAATVTANSAFHGTRLDVGHIADVMERLVRQAEVRLGIDRRSLATQLVFVSHETYTPARGGSASAEVEALRRVFGEQAAEIVVANTKGLTGHPMGVGIEDVVAIKALETGVVPPVPNYREPDPDLGPLHLSRGGAYPIRWALRLGAGFGSQISMSLLRWIPTPDGARPDSDRLGYESRLADREVWTRWLAEATGDPAAETEVVQRTLRVRDRGAPDRLPVPAPVAPEPVVAPAPVAPQPAPVATPAAPIAVAPTPAGEGDDADVRERVLAIVSEKTGYPPDMLDLDLDLEADLGIDTVKQAETFAAIRESWGIERDENLQLRDYPTIAHAIRFVLERRPGAARSSAPAAPPPAPAAAAATEAPAPTGDDADIRERVLAIVSEKTGYPTDMLDLDLDLEADLGIDTVKQAETFAAIRESWGIERDENLQLRDYPTIAHAIRFVLERRPGAARSSAPAAPPPAPAAAAATEAPAPTGDDADIRERVLAIVSEKTGYPTDMLDLDLDLEADLGIDTVKQAETFAAIRESWGIERDENLQLRDYPTIAHAIRFVLERRPGAARSSAPAAPPPAPAAAAATEAPAPTGDDADIRERVLAIVSEKTGYPTDMLDLDLDLEADLGIDTVKQAETFAAIRESWGIERDENLQLRDYPTIAHAIRFVLERRPAPAGDAPSQAARDSVDESAGEPRAPQGDAEQAVALRLRAPVAILRPPLELCKPTGVGLSAGSRVVVMPDRGGVARALAKRLEKRGVEVLVLEPDEAADALTERLATVLRDGPIHGLYWLPALDAEDALDETDPEAWRAALRLRIKLLYSAARALCDALAGPDRFLVSATRMGGRHGYDTAGALHPMGGAVAGFTKAFAREHPEALVKAVDFPETRRTAELADALLAETELDPGAVEIGLVDGRRFAVALEAATAAPSGGVELGADTVYLVTGAAGSIVSAITADLASAGGGTFHLLDLAPEPDRTDADLARFASDREGLQRTIFERLREAGERATPVQVGAALAELERAHAALQAILAVERAGGTVHWHQVDLRDAGAVAKVADRIRTEVERVDVVLHGAGMERSRQLADKPPEEFDLVFDVKCDGWFHLLHAFGEFPIGAVVFFSSISGRFGNAGQTDYSAANDLLCKLASHARSARPGTRTLALDWTAWADIGMASRGSIPQAMERAGIDMLDPRAGIPMVRRVLQEGFGSGELVVAGRLGVMAAERDETGGLDPARVEAAGRGPLLAEVRGMSLEHGLHVTTRLDPRAQPFLDHHRIEGTAVLPGVMGVEAFVEAALLLHPERRATAVEDVEFLAPFKFYRDEPREIEVRCRFREDGEDVLAECALFGHRLLAGQTEPQETLHFRGRVRLGTAPPALEDAVSVPESGEPVLSAEDLYRVYFHGPAYQVVANVFRVGDRVVGRFAEGLPHGHEPPELPLATRPRLLELCFQTAGAWEIASTQRMGLPQRFDRVRFTDGDAEAPAAALLSAAVEDGREVTVVDADGRALVHLEGYRTTVLPQALPEEWVAPLARALVGEES